MLSAILKLLNPGSAGAPKLTRREPTISSFSEESLEKSLEKEFSSQGPSKSLNPAYVQSLVSVVQR
ncbi:hypothetical protein [Pseudomonas putida]|uniref:Uncharacterized protein n=1 Tax=Pseudomonas putida TaxID=303 RepID=A0A8I1EBH1_PSEPU|nr:hypothetical protein [Pseudomonas putida]MBI6882446.1 hypothetical protein [Pseudomonas putida]